MRGVSDPNAMNEEWQTPLMAAASNSDEKLVKDLIERKANVNVGSRSGMTALMYARGLPTVKLLLGAGASVNDKDITGKTALYYAAQQADPDVVQALIKAGANVNAKDDRGISAYQLARLELLSDFPDKSLREAYQNRVQEVIDLLLEAGASTDLQFNGGVCAPCDVPGAQPIVSDLPNVIGAVRVPDVVTALRIAGPVLIKTYGKRQIDDERPLTAELDSGIWTVHGTRVCCSDGKGHRTCEPGACFGGGVELRLRQSDGKILSIMHYK
jgi:hypothetical protein